MYQHFYFLALYHCSINIYATFKYFFSFFWSELLKMQPLMCAHYRWRGEKHWLTTRQTFYATRAGLVHHMPKTRTAEHKTTQRQSMHINIRHICPVRVYPHSSGSGFICAGVSAVCSYERKAWYGWSCLLHTKLICRNCVFNTKWTPLKQLLKLYACTIHRKVQICPTESISIKGFRPSLSLSHLSLSRSVSESLTAGRESQVGCQQPQEAEFQLDRCRFVL